MAIKALLIAVRRPERGHKLHLLFAALPEAMRASLDARFEQAKCTDPLSLILEQAADRTLFDVPHATRAPRYSDRKIASVLEHSSALFEMWRYLHEAGSPGEVLSFTFECDDLQAVAQVLHDEYRQVVLGRP